MNAHTPKQAAGWDAKRSKLETYFDRTALDAWAAMTSDAPVSKIRATVRAGRQEMRDTLLSWLPQDLSGRRILDAGCGTGMLAIEAARRGAEVVGIDVSPQLIEIGKERLPEDFRAKISLHAGDMLDASFGQFDHIVSMDVLIHYESDQIAAATASLGGNIAAYIDPAAFAAAGGTTFTYTDVITGTTSSTFSNASSIEINSLFLSIARCANEDRRS